MKNKKGMAIVVVLFFAFTIAIMLFFMASSNSNLALQNKKALRQMQAYYLSQSAMQHAKLQLRLLPKETYDYFHKGFHGNPYDKVETMDYEPLRMGDFNQKEMSKYDLFEAGADPKKVSPYGGYYKVDSIELQASHNGMKMVQDSYKITVSAEVDGGPQKKASNSFTEIVIVSRFTGGIQ